MRFYKCYQIHRKQNMAISLVNKTEVLNWIDVSHHRKYDLNQHCKIKYEYNVKLNMNMYMKEKNAVPV